MSDNNEMFAVTYKPNVRLSGLFELIKTNEEFLDNEQICSYSLKCEVGFGHTLGVALRRTILCSTEGVAVVAMKLNDAPHLFSSVNKIKSSVLDISLSLQQIAFKFNDDNTEFCLLELKKKASANGEIITANDFEKNKNVTILNKDLQICSLDNNGEIHLQVIIAKGIGYVPFQDHVFFPYLPEGFFAVDSFFAPGVNCGYEVETNTSGKNIFDSVNLNISTNGTVSPDKILNMAGAKLSTMFSIFSNEEIKEKTTDEEIESEVDKLLNKDVYDLDELSIRSKNCLFTNNIKKVSDLIERTEVELMSLSGLGEKSLIEIKDFLSLNNLILGKKIIKKRKV